MKIIDKKINEIVENVDLNSKFSTNDIENIKVDCKILNDSFYLDSYNYYPITQSYYTFSEIFTWNEKNAYNNFYTDNFFKNFEENKKNFKSFTNITILGSSPANNYYRNLLTFLPRIFFLKDKDITLGIHRNTPNKFRNFILSITKQLKINTKFIFLDDNFYFFNKSKIPQFLETKHSIDILNNLRTSNDDKGEKIYLSRQKSSYRNLINENDIIELVKKDGFKIYDLNNIDIHKQIKLFSNAKVIISPTGSSLANLVFCSPKTKIIEISPKYDNQFDSIFMNRYSGIASQLNLDYHRIYADPINVKITKKDINQVLSKEVLSKSNYYKDILIHLNDFKKIL